MSGVGFIGRLRAGMAGMPILVRLLPFVVFAGVTALQGRFGEGSVYWVYILKTVLGVLVLGVVWPLVVELRWRWSGEAVGIGVLMAAVWVGLDPLYPQWIERGGGWNLDRDFAGAAWVGWLLFGVRMVAVTLVVPPVEELFYRSFLYRYVETNAILSVPLVGLRPRGWLLSAGVFGLVHSEWLAGILCGLAYQWLVSRRGTLGEAMVAHAVTNGCLGVWVVTRGAWEFW